MPKFSSLFKGHKDVKLKGSSDDASPHGQDRRDYMIAPGQTRVPRGWQGHRLFEVCSIQMMSIYQESLLLGWIRPLYWLLGHVHRLLPTGYPDLQRLPSDLPTQSFAKFDQTWPGSSVEAAASSTQGLQFRNAKGEGGGDLHIYIHVNHAQHSTPSSRFSSPLPCPQELGTQKDPWLWNSASGHPRQLAGGLNLMPNDSSPEFSTRVLRRAEYPHDDGVDYALSRDSRHPLPYPQTIGTPTGLPSLPRSPRAASPGSPRRAESEPSAGKWQKGHLLGSGAFGKVYKGIHSETGEFCAIKEVEFNQDDSKSKESAKQLAQEIALLSSFYHPNIVQGSELVSDSLYIYLELITGGSLYKLCQEFNKLEVPVIRRYTRQILLGLQFLHSRNIVHSQESLSGCNLNHGLQIHATLYGICRNCCDGGEDACDEGFGRASYSAERASVFVALFGGSPPGRNAPALPPCLHCHMPSLWSYARGGIASLLDLCSLQNTFAHYL